MAINIVKVENEDSKPNEKFYEQDKNIANIYTMQKNINIICNKLLEDDFELEETSELFIDYIKKYNRILYSSFSNLIYAYFEKNNSEVANQKIGTMLANVENLIEYFESFNYDEENKKYYEDARKASIKIWDHINLAQQQYSMLKMSDEEYKSKISKNLEPFKNALSNELNSQLLTMIGIFTSLAFLLFGGISSLENLFDNSNMPTLKFMIVGSIWGLCLINLLFVFIFCINKMINSKPSYTEDVFAFFQRYAIVFWSDFVLISILICSLWAYYLQKKNSYLWIDNIILGKEPLYTALLLIAILISGSILFHFTGGKKKEEKQR
ncbi:hypothetical protein [uncultured Fusobacterium sp.]|uniref:hypothetical protein n=1 Tax=uncultured Fusobacterium sp. TaxID=159267 RepID=UPI0025F318B6|nr:hypothetical protein [uncultured Fusobacterium sp.]